MKILRQTIRKLLIEGLYFDQLKNLALAKVDYKAGITYILFKPELVDIIINHKMHFSRISENEEKAILGVIHVENIHEWEEDQPCNGAMMVSYAAAEDGWGPTLYDIVMGDSSGGLIADRENVSIAAYDVWDFYNYNRSDIEKKELDWNQDPWTSDNNDDCSWGSNADYFEMKEPWMDQQDIARMDLNYSDWTDDPLNWSYNRGQVPFVDEMLQKYKKADQKLLDSSGVNRMWWYGDSSWGELGYEYFKRRLHQ